MSDPICISSEQPDGTIKPVVNIEEIKFKLDDDDIAKTEPNILSDPPSFLMLTMIVIATYIDDLSEFPAICNIFILIN